jgi:hypothetical protein
MSLIRLTLARSILKAARRLALATCPELGGEA